MKANDDFGDLALDVMGNEMGNELLFEAAKVVVACVLQELSSVVAISEGKRVATQHLQDVGEGLRRAIWDARGVDSWWAEKATRVEAGKYIAGRREEDGEAKREVIGGVPWSREDITGDTKVFVANLDEDFRFEELGLKPRYWAG